jgi:hypothetical protein
MTNEEAITRGFDAIWNSDPSIGSFYVKYNWME